MLQTKGYFNTYLAHGFRGFPPPAVAASSTTYSVIVMQISFALRQFQENLTDHRVECMFLFYLFIFRFLDLGKNIKVR